MRTFWKIEGKEQSARLSTNLQSVISHLVASKFVIEIAVAQFLLFVAFDLFYLPEERR